MVIDPATGIHWSYFVRNRGAGPTNLQDAWVDRAYLSTDALLGNDLFIGEFVGGNDGEGGAQVLLPGEGYTVRSSHFDFLQPGDYYVLMVVDANGTLNESDESNNLIVSAPLTVRYDPHPDFVVTGITAPEFVIGGTEFTVTWTTTNQGNQQYIGDLSNQLDASQDAQIGGDIALTQLGTAFFTALAPGESVTRRMRAKTLLLS